MVKNTKEKNWGEFEYKMNENYSENQKLFYNTLTQLKQKKLPELKNIKIKMITEEKDKTKTEKIP